MAKTPMMRQWSEIKRAYPQCIVLFRLGDFYEAFNEDAARVAELCDVTLTSRPVRKGERVPMAGVPYHAVDGYIAQMVRQGAKVAIVEQTGPEASPEKRARMSRVQAATEAQPETELADEPAEQATSQRSGRRIMEREVVRVVTPGTLVEGELLDAGSNNYLAGAYVSGGSIGLAYADITTGSFATTRLEGEDAPARLLDEVVRLRPAELLVPEREADDREPAVESLVRAIEGLGLPTLVAEYPAWRFDPETARRALLDHLGGASLAAYGCEGLPAAVGAAGAVLSYLQETQLGGTRQLTTLATYYPGDYMTLDAATRRNLELAETIRGDKRGSLLWVLDETVTAMGARRLRNWLERPLLDRARIEERLSEVAELVGSDMFRAEVRAAMKGTPDVERLTNRVVAGYAGPKELQALARGVRVVEELRRMLAERGVDDAAAPLLELCGQDVADVARTIDEAIAEDCPATLGVAGLIRPGYSEELDDIQAGVAAAKEWIASLEGREQERTGLKRLKVGYNKVFGYYIAVPKSQAESVPEDYQRKQTLVDSERYIIPELKEKESEVLHAEERVIALERELFSRLVARLGESATLLLEAASDLGKLDALQSLAEVAVRYEYRRPLLNEERSLSVAGGRHPVVERMPLDTPFVPNDMSIGDGEIVILTGPNMAGKSTVGRQAALIALMAQMGSFVPAESAEIGLVDRIFTRIGAQDELAAGRSTFMVEMVETANILNHATPRSLIVLDELGRGTSTYDGMAIAWAVIEHIHSSSRLRCRTLFATHYHELTALSEVLPRVKNYHLSVAEDRGRVVFLHRVEPGAADRSYGIHVAELAGLTADVIARAWKVLERLEAEGGVPLQDARSRPAAADGQLPLFAPASEEHPAVEALRHLDLDSLSPIEALNTLYELRGKLHGE